MKSKPGAYKTSEPDGAKVLGGVGKPRLCIQSVPGRTKEVHDGAGLASPGRWDVEQRCWCKEEWIKDLRRDRRDIFNINVEGCGGLSKLDKACFERAIRGEHGCNLVKDERTSGTD